MKDLPRKIIKAVKENTLVPSLRHVPFTNLPHTYHIDHLRIYNP